MPTAEQIEGWLAELGLEPASRHARDGVAAWDLRLDGRRRFDIPVTLILDPATALVVYVHYAPPIADGYRRSYRKLLRWNDEFPFAKFALGEDGRPLLSAEIATAHLDRDELGLAVARLLALCDHLAHDSAVWIWTAGKVPDPGDRPSRGAALLDRYASQLAELTRA